MYPSDLTQENILFKYLAQLPTAEPQTRLVVKDTLTTATFDTIRQLFNRLKQRSKIPRLHPHLLRHSFATRYLSNGGDVYTLQAILGHTTLEMTKRYTQLIPSKIAVNFCRHSPIDNLKRKPTK